MELIRITETGTDSGSGLPYVRFCFDGNFSVYKTFDCGQCFRFDLVCHDDVQTVYKGTVNGKTVMIGQSGRTYTLKGVSENEFREFWIHYLALDEDYGEADRYISDCFAGQAGDVMKKAVAMSSGIRLLHQDHWETLCSFIISQNNNIPRIKKIIERICSAYGKDNGCGGETFPQPDDLIRAGEDGLRQCGTGFRAGYILDAAERICDGRLDLDEVERAGYGEASRMLMEVKGIGPKVAACALLFGFGKTEAFPIDTWMKKVIDRHFGGHLEYERFGKYSGLAQQYLFYMERYLSDDTEEKKPSASGKIAVFDSGLGGLSVLRALVKEFPHEDFIYYGDSANAPYGAKTTGEVRELSLDIADRLISQGAKCIVIACNTATSAAVSSLREKYTLHPIIGMEPAIKPAALSGGRPRVLVMATPVTVREKKFRDLLARYEDTADIDSVGCKGIVGLVEKGVISGDRISQVIRDNISGYISSKKYDAVVLGCTHYIHVADEIGRIVGDDVRIYDGVSGTVHEVRRQLERAGLLRKSGKGTVEILNSDPGKIPVSQMLMR